MCVTKKGSVGLKKGGWEKTVMKIAEPDDFSKCRLNFRPIRGILDNTHNNSMSFAGGNLSILRSETVVVKGGGWP